MLVFTSGGISKLERYKALGVPEVWFWQDGLLTLYHLHNGSYERIDRSQLPGLNDLNLDLLRRYILMAETDVGEAIRLRALVSPTSQEVVEYFFICQSLKRVQSQHQNLRFGGQRRGRRVGKQGAGNLPCPQSLDLIVHIFIALMVGVMAY